MVTEIPWGDGSGDLIYLSYSVSEGDQTVLVSSDANAGVSDRIKTLTFSASHHGTSEAKTLTIVQEGVPEQYIVFADSAVETICANTWGDGVGLKPSQAAAVTSMSSTFYQNVDITTFDELRYFTGLTSLYRAFRESSLTKATLPSGLVFTASSAWAYIFYKCTSLVEVDLSDCVRSSNGQFQWFTGCSALTTLHFASLESMFGFNGTNTNTSDKPFGYNNSTHYVYINGEELIDAVIPNTITSIPPYVFYRYNRMQTVTIPSSVTSIGNYAFYQCTGLTGTLALPSNITSIGNYAFYQCAGLTGTLALPSNITSIGNYAFYQCAGLTSVSIPSTVTSIGQQAFNRCTGLTGDIVVPSSVTSIGDDAFAYATGITNLYILSTSTFTLTSINRIAANTTAGTGNGTGVLQFNGGLSISTRESRLSFKKLIVKGNMSQANLLRISPSCNYIEQIRVGGNYTNTYASDAANGRILYSTGSVVASKLIFIEIMGTITSGHSILAADNRCIASSGVILHLGYDGIPCAPNIVLASSARIAKIYVGDGSSAAHDDAILAQYTADTDWSAYSSKLDTWYNYSGEYKD